MTTSLALAAAPTTGAAPAPAGPQTTIQPTVDPELAEIADELWAAICHIESLNPYTTHSHHPDGNTNANTNPNPAPHTPIPAPNRP